MALFLFTGQAEEPPTPAEPETVDPVATETGGPVESSTGGMEVVVTATANRGLEQGLLDVPQSVSVITREDLDNQVHQDLMVAIRREAGIGLAPEGAAQNYWNPGFSIRGLGAQRVLTLTNGVRQAGQGIGYGGGFLSLYNSYSVESLEILRGPRSVVYGTDAIGGVINVISRKPEERDEFGVNGAARYEYDGGYDFHRGSAYVDIGGPKVGFVGGFSYTNSGEPNVPNEVRVDEGSYEQFGGFGQVDIHLYDNLTLSFLGNTDHNRDVLVADSSIGLPQLNVSQGFIPFPGIFFPVVAPNVSTFSAPLDFSFPEYNRHMAGTEIVFEETGETLEYVKGAFYWQQIERQFDRTGLFFQNNPGGPASPLVTEQVSTNDEVNTYEWQLISRWNPAENHQLTAGIDLGYDTAQLPETNTQTVVTSPFFGILAGGPFPPATLVSPGAPVVGTTTVTERERADAEQIRVGVYLQDTWTIGKFDLTPGVRFDYFDVSDDPTSTSESEYGFSGAIGGLYRVTEENSAYFNLASGFRVPDLGERFQDAVVSIGGASRVIGDPSLDPERSWSAEIGSKHESEKFGYRAALFYNLVEDYITDNTGLGVINGFSTFQFRNVGTVSLYGVELDGRYNFTPEWQVFGNASRTYTNDSNEVNVTDWVFNYGTSYRLPVDHYGIESITPTLLVRTVLDTDSTAGPSLGSFPNEDGFTVLDFQIALDTIESKYGQTKIIGGIHNLTNEEYFEPFFTTLQPERSFYVSIEHKF